MGIEESIFVLPACMTTLFKGYSYDLFIRVQQVPMRSSFADFSQIIRDYVRFLSKKGDKKEERKSYLMIVESGSDVSCS